MKIKATTFKRILAALLILATLCSVFASCTKSDEGNESDSNALGSDISTDANGNVIREGKQVLITPGDGKMLSAIYSVFCFMYFGGI